MGASWREESPSKVGTARLEKEATIDLEAIAQLKISKKIKKKLEAFGFWNLKSFWVLKREPEWRIVKTSDH